MIPRVQRVIFASVAILAIVASAASAQVPGPLRGTVATVAGRSLVVTARDGTTMNVKLADNVRVFALKSASLADLKRGRVVGTTTAQQMDGSQKPVEVYIFPDEPKREPNDAANIAVNGRGSEILNYAEGAVSDAAGHVVTMNYRDGEQKLTLPASVRIVMLVPTTVADIKAGQYVLAPNSQLDSLGALASTIIVGSDRADFAM